MKLPAAARAGLSLALLGLLVACEEPSTGAAPPAPPPVGVEVARTETLTPRAAGTAEVRAHRSARLRAEAPGRVVALEAEAGASVAAGDVLARLDVGRTAVALQAASAQTGQAEARVDQARREREMAERLVASGGAPSRALDDARDAERLASASLEAARAQVQVTRRGLTEAVVRAPFDGVVADRFVEVGEFVTPGAPIALVVDASRLEATVLLDPRLALDVPVGAHAAAAVHARPGESFDARVIRIGEVVDPRTRRLPVELELLDPQGRLRPGLVARFEVDVAPPRECIMVDSGALFERFGQSQLYVVRGEVAERRAVEVGLAREGRVEVVAGLSEGDQVVVAGLDRVVPDAPVRVVEGLARNGAPEPAAPEDAPGAAASP